MCIRHFNQNASLWLSYTFENAEGDNENPLCSFLYSPVPLSAQTMRNKKLIFTFFINLSKCVNHQKNILPNCSWLPGRVSGGVTGPSPADLMSSQNSLSRPTTEKPPTSVGLQKRQQRDERKHFISDRTFVKPLNQILPHNQTGLSFWFRSIEV